MRDEWIAVARGLKWLSVSIQLFVLSAVLTFFVIILFFCVLLSGPPFPLSPNVVFVPSLVLAILSLVSSRVSRIYLLKVPRTVPEGRFAAMASLILELVGQAGLGVFIALWELNIEIKTAYSLFGVATLLISAIAGTFYFQFLLSKIAHQILGPDSEHDVTDIWPLFVFAFGIAMVGIAPIFCVPSPVSLVLGLGCLIGALVFFGIAVNFYLWHVRKLRFIVLREAVRCERGPTEPD